MTLEGLLAHITTDKTALLFFFLLLPMITMFFTTLSSGKSLEEPYTYVYTIIIFIAAVPAVLSLTLWIYSFVFEQKALWELPFFIYYLPIIVLLICIFLIKKKKIIIKNLPWSAELYEFLILIVISFASTLIIMRLDVLNLHSIWKIGLFFLFWLVIFLLSWKQIKVILESFR